MPKLNQEEISIKIPRSKRKLSFLALISFGVGVVGWLLVKYSASIASTSIHYRSPSIVVMFGILSIIFSILGIIASTIQFFKTNPGLIIDENGITLFGMSPRHIDWSDISEFKVSAFYQANLINIYMVDTEGYIEKQKSKWQKIMMTFSYKRDRAILGVTTNDLDCDFDDLYELLTTRLQEYKEAAENTHYKSS